MLAVTQIVIVYLVGNSGSTYVAIRSTKHNKSMAESHVTDFNRILQTERFKDYIFNANNEVKPLVFISVDNGPYEAQNNLYIRR